MPDMNTLKITYLSETPLKIADTLLTTTLVLMAFCAIFEIVKIVKSFITKNEDWDDSMDRSVLVLALSLIFCFYFVFGFTAPYADVYVQVVPNMDIREFDMNHSRDFIKKGDDYYYIKTIKTNLFEKFLSEQGVESLSDVIKWNIERSVSGTREGDK